MIILFIIGLLLGAVAVVFALQNIAVVTITFFAWHLSGSLALILLMAMSVGILFAALLVLPETIKNYFAYKNLKAENGRLAEELRKQKELTVFAKTSAPTQSDISKIEQSAVIDTA